MEIKNLSQLKKAIQAKTPFVFVEHNLHPECVGQIRIPNIIQTNAFYSVVKDEPDHPVSKANCGMGYRMDFGKADRWEFDNGICKAFLNRMRNGQCERVFAFSFKFV
jgi:hypothetical protein